MKYIIGLDVGIGSVGWAVVRNEENCKRIEDFGVRIFDSGEDLKKQKRESQIRREYRGTRRQIRRRRQRKERLKNFLESIGLVSKADITQFFNKNDHDIIDIRVRALDTKISPQELAAALLNIANHRGYKPFYEEKDEKSNEGKLYAAVTRTEKIIKDGGYRSIAEAIMKDTEHFSEKATGRYKYRNSEEKNDILFPNAMYEEETRKILNRQKSYYPQLTEDNIEKIFKIIFSRRDFEDGPGNPQDENRPYKGFYDTIGNCPFYTNEKRGHRFTVIGDMFALVNKLSQYRYVSTETGEVEKLPENLMKSVVEFAIQNGQITKKELNSFAKNYCIEILNPETSKNENIADCFRFLKAVKPIFENGGFVWKDLIADDYLNLNSLLNRVGTVLSSNITPSRRIKALNGITELEGRETLIKKLSKQNFSGTANVSDRYMTEAITAFFKGTPSGEFQAQFIKSEFDNAANSEKKLKLPPFDSKNEYAKNPVVFRAINETRKIVNAIIEKYGAPNALNIEVAGELSKSFESRSKISKKQNENEKIRKDAVSAVAEILGISESEVNGSQIERYRLGELQGWRCMYSNEEISDKKEAIENRNKTYEVDHIVPFSRILDDTLNNKALVLAKENQQKSNKTPLMYLTGEKKKFFKSRVNKLYKEKKINKTKYSYFMLESLVGEEADKILGGWKTRNLNDTRYIAKFLVQYFKDNLKFQRESSDEKRPVVYAVKGAITSSLRRQWLNKETWGQYDKDKLKKITYFDHAVDAIVIANCLPAYVIIAAENQKLRDIYYSAGRKKTDEYNRSLENCAVNLSKFYGMNPNFSRKLLGKVKETPSLIENLRLEVEYRVRDHELMRYFIKDAENKSDEELDKLFRQDLHKLYYDDIEFADSIQMPIVSIKPERKYSGKITKDTLMKKNKADDNCYVKNIGESNISFMDDSCYYCVEVYTTKSGTTSLLGIKRTDIVKKDKKLYLKPYYKYPEDYAEHIMYLFKGDYIEISQKNAKTNTEKVKRRGFYLSINNINQNSIVITKDNTRRKLSNTNRVETCSISQKDIIKKYDIDILGKKGGEIKECGEPLSLLPENDLT